MSFAGHLSVVGSGGDLQVNLANRYRRHIASLLISAWFAGAAFAQTASDPSDPETWHTPEFYAQYGLSFIYVDYAYTTGVDGSGVKIGVIDTGFAIDHPEFIGRYDEGITVQPDRPWYVDENSVTHGSAVAGVIAANRDGIGMHGVAPGATIVAVNADIGGGMIDAGFARAGIYALVVSDVHIINNSYGMPGDITTYPAEEIIHGFEDDIAAYKYAVANDTLLIWSTGNDSSDQPSLHASMPYLIPELESGWLAVTGYDYEYGNHCGVSKNWCLTAPAYDIVTVDGKGGYQLINGTSFAAPHVAGVAALVKQMFPYMTMDQVRQVLLGTAIDIGDAGVDEVYGYGLLNAYAAVLGPGKFDWGDFNAAMNGGSSLWFNDITGTGGLVKSGDGLLSMFGESTYSGKTLITGGILALAGSITSETLVMRDGMLSGDGFITGNVDNDGTIYGGWGSEGGTLTIDGNYHQTTDAVMEVKVGAVAGTSRVDITGAADLEGGTVLATLNHGSYRGDARYTILTSGGLSGTFNGVSADYAFLGLTVDYDTNNAYLNVFRNNTAFADIGVTNNQRSVAAGIESLAGLAGSAGANNPSVAIYDLIIEANTANAQTAFDFLSGEIHSSVKSALLDESRFVRNAVSARLRDQSGTVGTDLSPAIWSQSYGSWGHLSGDADTAKLKRSSGGVYVGSDGDLGQSWRAGFASGYGNSSLDADERLSSASVKSYTVAAYTGTNIDALALRFGAAHTWHKVETDRLTPLGASSADYNARTAQVFGEIGYGISYSAVAFEPFANLAYANLHTDRIGEAGVAGLMSKSDNNDNAFSTLGLRAQTEYSVGESAKLAIRGMVGWQHAFGDAAPATTLAFSGGVPFSIDGSPLARDAFIAEAGLDLAVTKKMTLGVSYIGQMSSAVQAHGIRSDFSWKF